MVRVDVSDGQKIFNSVTYYNESFMRDLLFDLPVRRSLVIKIRRCDKMVSGPYVHGQPGHQEGASAYFQVQLER